jgi:serpin B
MRNNICLLRPLMSMMLLSAWLLSGGCQPTNPFPDQGSIIPKTDFASSDLARLTDPGEAFDDLPILVKGNNAFSFGMYQALRFNPGNLIFSPYSISVALAMTFAGARGETERQMGEILHFDLPQDRLHPAFNLLDLELANRSEEAPSLEEGEGTPFSLEVANSAWAQQGYPFLDLYLDTLALNYGSGLHLIDFLSDPEAARLAINAWVRAQTAEKIEEIIPPNTLDNSTTLVLANAIYFYAAWQYPFLDSLTQEAPFYLLDGGSTRVQMMAMPQEVEVKYTRGEDYLALDLPYAGETAAMTLLVPNQGQYEQFEASLNADRLEQILADMQIKPATVKLPRFRFDYKEFLTDTLKGMGLHVAFQSGQADFSGMDGTRNLYISDVIHAATIAVDEEGTEASAATVVIMMRGMAMEVDELVIDRPFIFLIRDVPTSQILFMGRVLNPGT